MYFNVYIAGCYFLNFLILEAAIVRCSKLFNLKAGSKYKKDKREGFYTWLELTPLIWNTFSYSNMLVPLRRTYPC